jgi:ArsR family transcriptional regulator
LTPVDFKGRMMGMPKPLPLLDPVATAATCCAPLAQAPLSAGDAFLLATRLKALADPARIRLVSILLASNGQEACTCELTEPLGLSQPTVSHHLKVLTDAGLIGREQRGRWAYFWVLPEPLELLRGTLAAPVGSR